MGLFISQKTTSMTFFDHYTRYFFFLKKIDSDGSFYVPEDY